MGHLERHDHVHDVPSAGRSTKISVHGTPRASQPWKRCSRCLAFNQHLSRMGRQLGHDHEANVLRRQRIQHHAGGLGHIQSHEFYRIFYSAAAWYARFEGGGDDTLPSRWWTRKDNACDASLPPVNGAVGNCTDTLVSGTSCVPECNTGYVLRGVTSCTNRVLTEVAVCDWQFTDGAELKATVDACLDAVPSGDRCCSSDQVCWHPDPAMRRCGAVGCVDMPDWDVSQVDRRARSVRRQIELSPGHHRLDLRRQREHDGDVHGRRHLASRVRRETTH